MKSILDDRIARKRNKVELLSGGNPTLYGWNGMRILVIRDRTTKIHIDNPSNTKLDIKGIVDMFGDVWSPGMDIEYDIVRPSDGKHMTLSDKYICMWDNNSCIITILKGSQDIT